MNSILTFVTLLILDTVLHVHTESVRICKYRYCYRDYWNRMVCSTSYCSDVITCVEGSIIDIKYTSIGHDNYYRYTNDCRSVCGSQDYLRYSNTENIMAFCNGKRQCELSQWNTKYFWTLGVIYNCTELATTPIPLTSTNEHLTHNYETTIHKSSTKDMKTTESQTSTVTKKLINESTGVSATSISTRRHNPGVTTYNNDSSRVAESKDDDNSTTDNFPVATVVTSITAGVFVFVIALIGIVCFKRRKANKGNTNIPCVHRNDRIIDTTVVANRAYDVASPLDHNTESDEHYEQQHEYAAADIASNTSNENEYNTLNETVNHEPRCRYGREYSYNATHSSAHTTNENEYNTLNETAKPFKADTNYDHIPKQSSSMNTAITKLNDDVYSTLNETVQHLNDDSNYDHVFKQSAPMDDIDTYSHVTDAKFEVHGADTYSHLNQ